MSEDEIKIIVIEDIKDFTHQLSKFGTNMNQLTVLYHQEKINAPNISFVNKVLSEIWKYLLSISKPRKIR